MAKVGGYVTQPWENARDVMRTHIRAMNKGGISSHLALRRAGYRPYMISWWNVSIGPLSGLTFAFPGAHEQVRYLHALKGIHYRLREGAAEGAYMDSATGWIYREVYQGCTVNRVGNPMNREIFLCLEKQNQR